MRQTGQAENELPQWTTSKIRDNRPRCSRRVASCPHRRRRRRSLRSPPEPTRCGPKATRRASWLVSAVEEVREVAADALDTSAVVDSEFLRGFLKHDAEFTLWLDPHELTA